MTGVDVEHTKALEQAATPGPWVASVVDSPRSTVSTAIYSHAHPAGSTESEVLPSYPMRPRSSRISRADAEFIAHARTAVPALVAAVERVQAQVDKTLEILDRYNHSDDGDLPECAPEDRWRLYRDLLATLNPEALETP